MMISTMKIKMVHQVINFIGFNHKYVCVTSTCISSTGHYKTSDDGILENYQYRLEEYEKYNPEIATDNKDVFHFIDGDQLKVPKDIWEKLYK